MIDRISARLVIDILRSSREILQKPGGWIKGAGALSIEGQCGFEDPGAFCWCAFMAIQKAISLDKRTANIEVSVTEAAVKALEPFTGPSIIFWNDEPTRTHEEVCEAFDKAIDKLLISFYNGFDSQEHHA